MGPAHKPRSLPLQPPQRRIPPWGTRLPTLVTALVTFLGAFLTAPFLLGRFKKLFHLRVRLANAMGSRYWVDAPGKSSFHPDRANMSSP